MVEQTLVPTKKYLQTGSHIGARFKTDGMKRYIFKKRKDGLKVLEVNAIDEKLRMAATFLAGYEPEKIAVISRKQYAQTPVKKFAKILGAKAFTGRFVPGTFTNPEGKEFFEPKVIFVADPNADSQAVKEATAIKAPIVALCSTDNTTNNIDLVVPINNNGRQSLALAYWVILREILKTKKVIKKDEDFKEEIETFEFKLKEEKSTDKRFYDSKSRDDFRGRKPRDKKY